MYELNFVYSVQHKHNLSSGKSSAQHITGCLRENGLVNNGVESYNSVSEVAKKFYDLLTKEYFGKQCEHIRCYAASRIPNDRNINLDNLACMSADKDRILITGSSSGSINDLVQIKDEMVRLFVNDNKRK